MIKKLFIVLLLGCFLGWVVLQIPKKPLSLETLASRVIQKCKNSNPREICYNQQIPKLMKLISMEDAFVVTTLVQNQDPQFLYCHVLGHDLASIETKKDPSKWKDVVGRCPSGVCSNGCVHGAFQEKYKDAVLTGTNFTTALEDFKSLCETSQTFHPTGLEQGSCYHALGHLLMYVTGGNITKSVATCDEVAKKKDGRDYSNLCYAGAFMQIFQPLDTDDKALVRHIAVDKTNAWAFCSKFADQQKTSCWQEAWPLFLGDLSTAPGLLNFCTKLDTPDQKDCFTTILYIMPIQFRFNFTALGQYCSALPQPHQSTCFAMTASRLLEIDKRNSKKTVDFCAGLEPTNRSVCFDEVLKDASFDFHPGSVEFNSLCQILPELWKSRCHP